MEILAIAEKIQEKINKGKSFTTLEEQNERWIEHFHNILNRPPPEIAFSFGNVEKMAELDVCCEEIILDELKADIHGLRTINHQVKIKS